MLFLDESPPFLRVPVLLKDGVADYSSHLRQHRLIHHRSRLVLLGQTVEKRRFGVVLIPSVRVESKCVWVNHVLLALNASERSDLLLRRARAQLLEELRDHAALRRLTLRGAGGHNGWI